MGTTLLIELPITFSQAALGVELEVPTILSEARITIPAGIQAGQILRLRGQGMPKLRANGRGDQLVRVRVWTPTDVGPEQLSACSKIWLQLNKIRPNLVAEMIRLSGSA